MKIVGRVACTAALLALAGFTFNPAAALGATQADTAGAYRVLAPISSGDLLLFPVVRANESGVAATPFLTLDEGLKGGEVEVTEAGQARGMVRPRGSSGWPTIPGRIWGDQVNTLVLVNHSRRPLLLLAGEIVTGGKQDRVIARDRIVPAGADPIDLSVFCIEPGRWIGDTASFAASAKAAARSIMAQPGVREHAMADQDQQQVWDSVRGVIAQMQAAAPPSAGADPGIPVARRFATTSYARVMQNDAVSDKVDETAAPALRDREQVLAKLREERAVGIVVAVHGEIIWADLFANTDLLARYWTKLVRSYAAEALGPHENHAAPTVADAQRFLDMPSSGTESSEGALGVYRYRTLKGGDTKTFVLESLLPGTGYDVHISKMKLRPSPWRVNRPQPFMPREPRDPPVIFR